MPKTKQQKMKDRERRVAQKKLADAESRAQVEATTKKPQATSLDPKKLLSAAAGPKPESAASDGKHSFARRRSIG